NCLGMSFLIRVPFPPATMIAYRFIDGFFSYDYKNSTKREQKQIYSVVPKRSLFPPVRQI
ncbi:hypothetical protein, partial [Barnesiella intestinihominis]|uniref:hypothetical protein n=1 Tax=Barnesiella intestinihominis TaxID=487174 RepID=UPI003AB7F641